MGLGGLQGWRAARSLDLAAEMELPAWAVVVSVCSDDGIEGRAASVLRDVGMLL